MGNTLLYIIPVLIWGSTWLAIKFQLGVVAPELSVAYRFLLGALILFAYSKWRGLNLRFSRSQHAFMALQGLLLFSLNYVMVYFSEVYVTSGLVAVLFSALIVFNVLFGALFLRTAVSGRILLGAFVGVFGVALIFWPEVAGLQMQGTRLLGITLGMLAALSASLGNIVSARNQRAQLPVMQTNAYGMLYGSLATLAFAVLRGTEFTFDPSLSYVGSLLYLALFGSVIAFGSYLTLLGRIGADRAAYVNVLVPMIALALSVLFEGLQLGWFEFAGVALVLLGNVIVVNRRQRTASA
ncbi:MAG TPA: EamA family transporter [Anaerolineales bacterium]|nr:EamA family transporter [Anaerolineales bacterium]HRQ92202.1 EamA family transporter [Anaerolineales bacterium]